MTLSKLKFVNFTAFASLEIEPSPGVNVFVGANGTGKTHLMKGAYAACDVSKTRANFAEKLIRVFLPSGEALGRLAQRKKGVVESTLEICRSSDVLRVEFSSRSIHATSAKVTGMETWTATPMESVFIPVKEMLSNAPGFRSLYAQREIHFEEIYVDILDRAYRPALRDPLGNGRKQLLQTLQKHLNGQIATKNEEFFLRNKQGDLEFTLLAEGFRKLGLLWLLIQNGTLDKGSVLFWDEPEANLNPKLFGPLIEILLELQRRGVQIFLATHDYVILKELDLRKATGDQVCFYGLFRDQTGEIQCTPSEEYTGIHPNAIAETFADLYDREIQRNLIGAIG